MSQSAADAPAWPPVAAPDAAQTQQIHEATRLPKPVVQLLQQLGHVTPQAIWQHLQPQAAEAHDPFAMADMDTLVGHLAALRRTGDRRLLVHGDYDADGLTATAILTRGLRNMGYLVTPFVPERVRDGYGVAQRAIDDAYAAGIRTVLTCDTGSSASAEVAHAKALGMTVLVTDHHLPPDQFPPADAFVNPTRPDCAYPFKGLCGAGVAYKTIQAVARRLGLTESVVAGPLLDFVTIGTICDVMPLTDENRAMVRRGLQQLRRTEFPGLAALAERCGVPLETIDEKTIGWTLGPRLNAPGRIGDPMVGLQLLLTDDLLEARRLADEVEAMNDQRRSISARVEQAALEQATATLASDPSRAVLVLHGPHPDGAAPDTVWHPGVVGVAAPRIVQHTGVSTFLFAWDQTSGQWKGSGRAPQDRGLHLHAALKQVAETQPQFIAKYGGHAEAAGLSLAVRTPEEIAAFADALDAVLRQQLAQAQTQTPATGDKPAATGADLLRSTHEHAVPGKAPLAPVAVDVSDITPDLLRFVRLFGPFGQGVEIPEFVVRGELLEAVRMGKQPGKEQAHLRLTLRQGDHVLKVLGWNQGQAFAWCCDAAPGTTVEVVGRLTESTHRDTTEPVLELRGVRVPPDQTIAPQRGPLQGLGRRSKPAATPRATSSGSRRGA